MQEVKRQCRATEREREYGLQVFRSALPRQIDRHLGTIIQYLKSPAALPYRRQIGCQPHNQGCSELSRLLGPVAASPLDRVAVVAQLRHCTPVNVCRGGCFFQFGRTSAPTMPHFVQTMRGPNQRWRR
jgi:hypothetical protein